MDIFGTQRAIERAIERRREANKLRDDLFQIILDGLDYLYKAGLMKSDEYFKWRLEFDKQRYNIAD